MTKRRPLLEVNHLWKVFGGDDVDVTDAAALAAVEANGAVGAVRDISFSVPSGQVFVIMGLSGSGKSTLIRCLLRLVEPTSGRILVDGNDVTAMDAQQLTEFRRTRVAMIFQHYGLLPHRTVLQNVAFGLKLRGMERAEREERARVAIQQVGLAGWENRYPSDLSGGMQQRVGIARALVQDTEVLLMDEPFSGLDPLIRREMQDELLRLQAELHKTILFVTHDLGEALRVGDRMAVMRQGEFVQVGEPRDILLQPADEYVRRFVQDERRVLMMVEGGKSATVRGMGEVAEKPQRARLAAGDRG
ncbi:MAG TPA: betaine/proline/choline family ABC transporter ATP-binding protein [Firmicutes bacterium]|nr:betaine/proline/choline family ABC transporter ATP-binding protein [Bacillota bacterium]